MKVVQHHSRTTMRRRAVTSCGFVVFCPLSLSPPDFLLLVAVANSTAIAVAAAVLFSSSPSSSSLSVFFCRRR